MDQKINEVGIENCYVSEITLLEILYGVENSDDLRKAKNRASYNKFAHLFQQNIIPIATCYEIYAKEKARLKKEGELIGEFDMLIGSTAAAMDCVLVTRNIKHFNRLKGLTIENWIDD